MSEAKEAKMAEAVITEEMIADMRSKIGLKLRTQDSIHNEVATRMAIVRFANGIGDPNPLWSNEAYAKKTRYGNIIAPPSFVWATMSQVQFGFTGLAGFHSGCDIEFYRPIYLNDKISAEQVYTGFEGPKASEFAEEMVLVRNETKYWNQRAELVAKYLWWVVRIARAKARKRSKYHGITLPHPWEGDELKKIEDEVMSEEIRGSTPRYWEDVEIGEELKPVVKGPLGLTDMIAYFIGGGTPIPWLAAYGMALRQYRRHPAWAFRDPITHALEPIFAVHYNKEAANAMGLPMQYDVGLQRHCWGIHLITNWMGDDSWLKRSYAEYRKFVYLSDVVWVRGKVTKKYVDEDGDYCVEIERHAINQRGKMLCPARR
jgi:acyl dehydratase